MFSPGLHAAVVADGTKHHAFAAIGSSLKRKRSLTSDLDEGSRSTPYQAPSVTVSTKRALASDTSALLHRPSEGLPTPLLSPTESKMEDFPSKCPSIMQNDQRSSDRRRRRIKQVVEQQINLEILLKHKELRLIDQELAKCQASLEQLRRCKEIPYPAFCMDTDVSTGQGRANRASFVRKAPSSPAPWGVTDGPYSRHYAQWLLPDPRFDGGEIVTPPATLGKRPSTSRYARISMSEETPIAMSSRSQRAGHLQALPPGYGQPKEKSHGPLLLKRKSDGVMVKLICPVCSRGDFGSAQGFINHCRIGHGRNFASHDQAAEQCGEPIEVDQHGAVVGHEVAITPKSNSVHPLIRTARLSQSKSLSPPTTDVVIETGPSCKTQTPRPSISPDFRGSAQTPHLSELVKTKGLGLNLQGMVIDAQEKVDLPDSDEDLMDEDDADNREAELDGNHARIAGTRGVKKPTKSSSLTSPTLFSRLPGSRVQSETVNLLGEDANHELEPSPTTESNQAPSLIDDDEDYEAQSPPSSSTSEAGDIDENIHFTVREEDDFHGHVELTHPDTQPSCAQAAATGATRPMEERRPSSFRSQETAHEPKHVTFVSENPALAPVTNDKKRRKVTKN